MPSDIFHSVAPVKLILCPLFSRLGRARDRRDSLLVTFTGTWQAPWFLAGNGVPYNRLCCVHMLLYCLCTLPWQTYAFLQCVAHDQILNLDQGFTFSPRLGAFRRHLVVLALVWSLWHVWVGSMCNYRWHCVQRKDLSITSGEKCLEFSMCVCISLLRLP